MTSIVPPLDYVLDVRAEMKPVKISQNSTPQGKSYYFQFTGGYIRSTNGELDIPLQSTFDDAFLPSDTGVVSLRVTAVGYDRKLGDYFQAKNNGFLKLSDVKGEPNSISEFGNSDCTGNFTIQTGNKDWAWLNTSVLVGPGRFGYDENGDIIWVEYKVFRVRSTW
jgi:hypothetical protein